MRILPRYTLLLLICAVALVGCDNEPSIENTGFDQWPVSTPAAQGLDDAILGDLTTAVRNGQYGDIESVVVVRNGSIVYEEYFRGASRTSKHQVYSVTKSFTSALVGIALDQGHLESLNTPMLDFFSSYESIQYPSALKSSITVQDLLDMRAGFEWPDNTGPFSDPNNPTTRLASSRDWIQFMLDRPMAFGPDESFVYNNGITILLSGILNEATGMSAEQFARRNLLLPIGIDDWDWEEGPNGITNTGWGLHLTPRDMARFGLLYLDGGVWGNEQLVPKAWVDSISVPSSTLSDGRGYRNQWWLTPNPDDSALIPYAAGYGGQSIFIIPKQDMVVVTTANNFGESGLARRVVFDFVLPAVL